MPLVHQVLREVLVLPATRKRAMKTHERARDYFLAESALR
jgi:hypothetical protein